MFKTEKDDKGLVSKRDCIDFIFIKCEVGYKVNDSKNACADVNECKITGCPKYSQASFILDDSKIASAK